MIPVIKTVSTQTADVYKLLNRGEDMSIHEIADELNVLPNGLYRQTNKLLEFGAIEVVDGYPVRFRAVPAQTALNMYLLAAAQSFRRELGIQPAAKNANGPIITLIKDRESLVSRTNRDVRAAQNSVDFIVSGDPVPDEVFMAYRKAAVTGLRVRRIVNRRENTTGEQAKIWKEIGVEARYLPDFKMRMFIIDRKIVYITSYDPKNLSSGFGVRFLYEPLALQMTDLFEQNWQKAMKL